VLLQSAPYIQTIAISVPESVTGYIVISAACVTAVEASIKAFTKYDYIIR